MKVSLLIVVMVFFSCKENKNNKYSIKDIEIKNELYNKIIDYQSKNPIPIQKEQTKNPQPTFRSSLIFVYEVKFLKEESDVIMSITLHPNGISNYYSSEKIKSEVNGMYKDSFLKATYIHDPYKLGNFFVNKYLNHPNEIDKYYYKNNTIIDSMYDIYLYKIKNGKLNFYKILKGNNR
jgi:hypothetical protein